MKKVADKDGGGTAVVEEIPSTNGDQRIELLLAPVFDQDLGSPNQVGGRRGNQDQVDLARLARVRPFDLVARATLERQCRRPVSPNF